MRTDPLSVFIFVLLQTTVNSDKSGFGAVGEV